MTDKKKMYKYTSIISLAIVLMLIGNLMLPMFTLAEGEGLRGQSSSSGRWESTDGDVLTLNSTMTRPVASDGSDNKLNLQVVSEYNGNKQINIALHWASMDIDSNDIYTEEEIRSDLNEFNEDSINNINEFILGNSITSKSLNIGTFNEEYTMSDPGYYYAVIIAKEVKEGEEADEIICANICMITVEDITYADPDAVTLQTIAIKEYPNRNYTEGDEISLEGLVLTASYSDGHTADISMSDGGISLVSNSTASADNNTVTIAYGGKEISFNITVNTKEQKRETVTIKGNPTNTVYTQGQEIDLTGGKLLVTLESGDFIETDMTDSEVILKSGKTADVASPVVVLEYRGQEISFGITVNPAEEKPAEIERPEEKKEEEKPTEEKPAEEKPAEEKPAENKQAEVKPATNTNANSNVQNVNPNKATNQMPQTGSNNTPIIIAIVVFSVLGAVNFIKYRTTK